jgi:hypothetical protein
MNRELIDMNIKEAIEKVVDTLENHNTDQWRPDGYLDGRIHDLIQDAVVSAIHSIADDLSYKFKLGSYANEPNTKNE